MRDEGRAVVSAHAALSGELGRPPTMYELAQRLGTPQQMIRCYVLDEQLQLTKLTKSERATISRRSREAARAKAEKERKRERERRAKMDVRIYHIEPVIMENIKPVVMTARSGLPGRDVSPDKVMFAQCARCGRRILVRPRTHPWWHKISDMELSPVCCGYCAGMYVYTVYRVNT